MYDLLYIGQGMYHIVDAYSREIIDVWDSDKDTTYSGHSLEYYELENPYKRK